MLKLGTAVKQLYMQSFLLGEEASTGSLSGRDCAPGSLVRRAGSGRVWVQVACLKASHLAHLADTRGGRHYRSQGSLMQIGAALCFAMQKK